jgi:HEAT repeat protein
MVKYVPNHLFERSRNMKRRIIIAAAICAVIVTAVFAGSAEFADYLSKGIDDLIGQLGSDQWETREKATEDLMKLGLLAKPALEKALVHQDAEVRERASQILFPLRWQESFNKRLGSFTAQLKSKNISDLNLFNEVLYFVARGESAPLLVDVLKDTSQLPKIRENIASALGSGVVNPLLKDILEIYNGEKDEQVREKLIYLMGRVGKDEKVIAVLLAALSEQSHTIKNAALRTLGDIGDSSVIPVILKVLQGTDNNIKNVALYVLNRFHDESVKKELIRIMKEDTFGKEGILINLRMQAIGTLANYRLQKLIPDFLELAKKDKDPNVKIAVINALGQYRNEKSISPALVELYPTADPAIQPNILSAIQSVGDKDVIPILITLLSNQTDYDVFHRMLGTLQALASNQRFAPPAMPPEVKDGIIKQAREWWDKNKPG